MLVASRSKNHGKISFMFEIISREKSDAHYYARYLVDYRFGYPGGERPAVWCLEYHGDEDSTTYFDPLTSIVYTLDRGRNNTWNNNHLLIIYMK